MAYKTGEVVLPAECPVIATDRFDQFGNQILCNTALRGNFRDCIVWRGNLYSADMAARLRNDSIREAAHDLLAALQALVERGTDSPEHIAAERAISKAIAP